MHKNNNKTLISVVIPLFNGAEFVTELYERLCVCLSKISAEFEIIFVNDGSPDDGWSLVCDLCGKDQRVKGVNLSRNFGQHYAITAGLGYAQGEWIVVMDCDLQDRPEEIAGMYEFALSGYDSVFAQRINRKDSVVKRAQSWLFYKVFSFLTDTKIDSSVANFGIYHRNVVEGVLSIGDKSRCFPVMVQWVGFKKAYLPVQHAPRKHGKSSYRLIKLLVLSLDVIISFSNKPLKICVFMGFVMSGISGSIALIYFIWFLLGVITVAGYASLILSVWFVGGVLMAAIGVVGIYIAKIFNQVKNRPIYIVSSLHNL